MESKCNHNMPFKLYQVGPTSVNGYLPIKKCTAAKMSKFPIPKFKRLTPSVLIVQLRVMARWKA